MLFLSRMYLLKPIVSHMDSDRASRAALRYFRAQGKIPGGRWFNRHFHKNRALGLQKEVFGLDFYNPVGLGAGLDRKGDMYNDLCDLGFSFVEVGPMGLENVRIAIKNLLRDAQDDILAVCIDNDFQAAFCLAYDYFDFFVIDLGDSLDVSVLEPLLDARLTYDVYKPVVVKVSPSATREKLQEIVDFCRMNGIDGIEVCSMAHIGLVNGHTEGRWPIIANCRIRDEKAAREALDTGASLIEVRSALVYNGPSMIDRILVHLGKSAG